MVLLLLVTTASLAGAVSSLSDGSTQSTEFLFLKLFTTSGSSIYSFATFIAFLGPLVGITLGFDAVNNERPLGTLNRLAAQPIYRDDIINAKFLAAAATVGVLVLSLGLYGSGLGLLLTGVPPEGEEILRLVAFLLLCVVYICVAGAGHPLFGDYPAHSHLCPGGYGYLAVPQPVYESGGRGYR